MNRNFGPPGGSASNPSNGNPGNGGEGMDPNALASLIVELLSRSPQMSSNAQNAFGTMMPTPQQQPFMAQMSQASQIPRTSQMPQITPIPLQNVTANAVSQIGNILSAIRMGILSMPSQQQSVAAQSSSHPAGIVIPQTDGPVGIYHDDEQRLVQNLIEAEKRNVNHLQALEALHGVNNHSATAWKDYFIIHHKRLNELAANALSQSRLPPPSQSTSTANSASVGRLISIGSDSSLGRNGNIPSRTHELPRSTLPQPQRQPPPRSHQESRAVRVRRPTERARGQSDQDSRVYRSAERRPEREKKRSDDTRGAQIPDLPSRAPTPPTQVEPAYGGNRKFTEDDKKYFINFILWKTNHQPGITRDELCRLLGRKAKHHSWSSWQAYWSRNSELPDRILAAASTRSKGSNRRSSDTEPPKPVSDFLPSDDASTDASDTASDTSDEEFPETDEDIEQLGHAGSVITAVELRMIARYELSRPGWVSLSYGERWDDFHAEYPMRTAKAWAEVCRKHTKEIQRWVRKCQRRKVKRIGSSRGPENAGPASRAEHKRKASSPLSDYRDKRVRMDEGSPNK